MTFNAAEYVDNVYETMPHISEIEKVPDKYNNAISRRKREIMQDEPAKRLLHKAQLRMLNIKNEANDEIGLNDQVETQYHPFNMYNS